MVAPATTGRVARLVAALIACGLLQVVAAPAAQASPVTWYRTAAASGVSQYLTLADAPTAGSFATSIRHGTGTGSFRFQPPQANTTATGFPGSSGSGFGYATSAALSGTVPSGAWSFAATVETDIPSGVADGRVLVAVYAVGADGASRRLHVQQDTTNVLSGPGTRSVVLGAALPALTFNGERLVTEWYLVVSQNGAPSGNWTTALRHGAAGDTVVAPGPPSAPALIAPSNLAVTGIGDRRVSLSWSPSPDSRTVGYVVRRATSSAGPWADASATLAGTSFGDTGLTNGTRYYYTVVAVASDGSRSGPSNTVSAVPFDDSPPDTPSGLAVSPSESFRLQVSWNASVAPDVAGYEVQRSASSGGPFTKVAGPVSGTSYTDGGLPSGSTWHYRVVAVDQAGLRSPPTAPEGGTVAPSPPTGLRVVAVADGAVALAWDGTAEAVARYRIERATSSSGPFAAAGTTTGTSFTDSGLVNGTTYHYRVRAEDAAGARSSPSSTVSARPENTGVPAPPPGLDATELPNNRLRLDWPASPSGSTVGYRVYRATSGAFTAISGVLTVRSFTDGPLPVGVRHRYHVRAVDASGAESIPSTEVSYTVPPAAPRNLRLIAVSETAASLAWDPTDDPNAGYRVLRSTTSGGPYTLVSGKVGETRFTDGGLVTGTDYFYVVQAESVDGTRSGSSNQIRVMPVDGPPTPPTGVQVVDTGAGGQLRVTWSANVEPDIAHYRVQRSTSSAGPWVEAARTTSTTFLDSGLANGTRYHYRVLAVDTSGLVSLPSVVVSAIPADTTPPGPPGTPVVSVVGASLRVQWAPSTGAVRYEVLRATSAGGPYAQVGETAGARAFSDTTVVRGTDYVYVVRGLDQAGNASVLSNESQPARVPVALAPPPGTRPPPGGGAPRGPIAGGPTETPAPSPTVPPVAQPPTGSAPQPEPSPTDRPTIAIGDLPTGAIASDQEVPQPTAADEAFRAGQFPEAIGGTVAEVAQSVGAVARTFRLPLVLLCLLFVYLLVQGRIDRKTLPTAVEAATGAEDDDVEYLL